MARGAVAYVDDTIEGLFRQARQGAEQVAASAQVADDYEARPLEEYQNDPLGYIERELEVPRHTIDWALNPGYDGREWDATPDPFVRVLEALVAWENVAVQSATGTGKSFLGACIILWFLAVWPGARVFTFAPKEAQLRLYIWKEIGKLLPKFRRRFPRALLLDLKLYVNGTAADRDDWAAFGFPVQVKAGETVASNAAGMHAPHMLLMYEEGQGIAGAVLEAGQNTCTADHNMRVIFGNPDSRTDQLHKHFERPDFRGVRVSALDHPNVVLDDASIVPGAVGRKSINARRVQRGEHHWLYQSRVRGIPPDQSTHALFRLEWIHAAQVKQRALYASYEGGKAEALADLLKRRTPQALGVDPSQSPAGDMAGTAYMVGPYLFGISAKPCPNATHLGFEVWQIAKAVGIAPECIGCDPIGVGAATVNELRKWAPIGTNIPQLGAGQKPIARIRRAGDSDDWQDDSNTFENLRAQLYWQAMNDLQAGLLGLEDDDELVEELTVVTYSADTGKLKLMPKDEARELLGRSPNKADAFVLANWVRVREVVAEAPVVNIDQENLGFTRSATGKVRPKTGADVARETHRPAGRGRGVKKWW